VGTDREDDDGGAGPASDATGRPASERDAAVAAALAATAPDRVVEVGVGGRFDVARALAERGVAVTVTDVDPDALAPGGGRPEGVTAVRDDVTDPDPAVYRGGDLVYALRCPPELHGPLAGVAGRVGAAAAFTTLGGDPPAVDAAPERAGPTTLYRVRGRGR